MIPSISIAFFEGLFSFPNLANHLVMIGIYVILALSLNLINGTLGAFSLGHHAFMGMGAYAAGATAWSLGSAEGHLGVFVLSFGVAILAASLFGLLAGIPCLRLRGDYLAIATLGLAEIFVIGARNSEGWTFFGPRGLGGAAGFSLGDDFEGGNDVALRLTGSIEGRYIFYLVLTWLMATATFILIRRLIASAHGRAILAIREDETAAELCGVNLTRYKVLAFVTGAAFAGLAGALFAHFRASVAPAQFLLMEGIKILLMIVLGGLGSMSGAIIAVFLLYTLEQALGAIETSVPFPVFAGKSLVWAEKPLKDLWQIIFSLMLVILMLWRPRGLMGRRECSLAFWGEILACWKSQPLIPFLTLAQGLPLIFVLAFDPGPFFLLGALILLVTHQKLKEKMTGREGARGDKCPGIGPGGLA